MGTGQGESGGGKEGKGGGVGSVKREEGVGVGGKDLMGLEVLWCMFGNVGPMGGIRERLGVCELFGGRREEVKGWGPLKKGGLEVVVTGSSVECHLKVCLEVTGGGGVLGIARGKRGKGLGGG